MVRPMACANSGPSSRRAAPTSAAGSRNVSSSALGMSIPVSVTPNAPLVPVRQAEQVEDFRDGILELSPKNLTSWMEDSSQYCAVMFAAFRVIYISGFVYVVCCQCSISASARYLVVVSLSLDPDDCRRELGTSDHCGPCHLMKPEFTKLAACFPSFKFAYFNISGSPEHQALATKLRVRAIPAFRVYKKSRKLEEVTGARPTPLRQMLLSYFRPF
eukprot:gene9617-7531_t